MAWNVSRIKKLNPQTINNMSITELKSAIKTAQGAINKRISRQVNFGSVAPELNEYLLSDRISASTKGMTEQQATKFLREQLRTGKGILSTGSTTLRGWQEILTRTNDKLQREQGFRVSGKELSDMLTRYDRAKEQGLVQEQYKYEFMRVMHQYRSQINKGQRKRMPSLKRMAEQAYKMAQESREAGSDIGYTGVSSFFE